MRIDLRDIMEGEKTLAGEIVWAPVSAFDDGFEVPLNLNGVTVERSVALIESTGDRSTIIQIRGAVQNSTVLSSSRALTIISSH